MENTFVISGLRAKRAEIDGELQAAEKRVSRLRIDLDAIDRALLVFDPTFNPKMIKPKRPRPEGLGKRTGIGRIVVNILRTSESPLTVRDIAVAAGPQLGVDVADKAAIEGVVKRVRALVRRTDGLVSKRFDDVVKWRVE